MKNRTWLAVAVGLLFINRGPVGSTQTTGPDSYRDKCLICHGTTGLGDTQPGKAMNVRPFSSSDIVAMSDSTLLGILDNGSGKMPAYKGKITDDEANKLIQYIRELQVNH